MQKTLSQSLNKKIIRTTMSGFFLGVHHENRAFLMIESVYRNINDQDDASHCHVSAITTENDT